MYRIFTRGILIMLALGLGALMLTQTSLRAEWARLLADATTPPAPVAAAPTVAPTATLAPTTAPTMRPSPTTTPTASPTSTPTAAPTVTPAPSATASPTHITIAGRVYDAYIPAANKAGQLFQYTCEFDAAWVVLQTFGIDASVEDIIARVPVDTSSEPSYKETSDGFVIYGGDIRAAYSGDYRKNFMARSTGSAFVPVFASFGLQAAPVSDRAGVEAALRRGALVWMKTTVDFKPWRPATWITPAGDTIQTVLGNDHAVVVIGFNDMGVVIRDVLGPTSSNRQRATEYEVDWPRFLRVWAAQSFDGLAVDPPDA